MISIDRECLHSVILELQCAATQKNASAENLSKVMLQCAKLLGKTQIAQKSRSITDDSVLSMKPYIDNIKPHKTVPVMYEKLQKTVEIDEGLVELIQLLWSSKIHTRYSCQGHPNTQLETAYIMLEDGASADNFVKAINMFPTENLKLMTTSDANCMVLYGGPFTAKQLLKIHRRQMTIEGELVKAQAVGDELTKFVATVRFLPDQIGDLVEVFKKYSYTLNAKSLFVCV